MSNLLVALDLEDLHTVTGGTKSKPSGSTGNLGFSSDGLVQQLNSLSTAIKDINSTAKKTGFSTTEVLMLGLLLNQRSQVNVFVRRPFW